MGQVQSFQTFTSPYPSRSEASERLRYWIWVTTIEPRKVHAPPVGPTQAHLRGTVQTAEDPPLGFCSFVFIWPTLFDLNHHKWYPL